MEPTPQCSQLVCQPLCLSTASHYPPFLCNLEPTTKQVHSKKESKSSHLYITDTNNYNSINKIMKPTIYISRLRRCLLHSRPVNMLSLGYKQPDLEPYVQVSLHLTKPLAIIGIHRGHLAFVLVISDVSKTCDRLHDAGFPQCKNTTVMILVVTS